MKALRAPGEQSAICPSTFIVPVPNESVSPPENPNDQMTFCLTVIHSQ